MGSEFGMALAILVAGIVLVRMVGPGRRASSGAESLDSWFANRTDEGRTVGGRMLLLVDSLRFEPNGVERGLGRSAIEVPYDEIAQVDLAPRGRGIRAVFDGSARRRLRIRTAAGVEHLFVVNRGARRVAMIQARRGAPSPIAQ